MSEPTTPGDRPEHDAIRGTPGAEGRPGGAAPTDAVGVPDGDGLPGAAPSREGPDGDGLPGAAPSREGPDGAGPPGGGLVSTWRRTYGASPAHLLLHLAGIALCAWALAQSFDTRYEAVYLNLALWMVGGAVLNDFVALPIYVGLDRLARAAWGRLRGTTAGATAPAGERRTPLVLGNGHVRFPVVMSAVLLLVYFPNIMDKAAGGYRLTTGLSEPPDYAARWLLLTAGLFVASAVIYGLRVAAARAAARRPSAP